MLPSERHKTVLVVEDEEAIADVLGTVLTTEGYDVVFASNGQEGLEKLDPHPDLVLLDAIMPVLGGGAMLQEMKRDPDRASIPVMLMSASPRHVASASVPVVRKPFELDELLGAIERLIGPAHSQ
jgi:CheY-like chemotaxis protein